MTMPVLDGPMTMPVLDELNQWQLHYPFAEQASLCFEREKKAYIAGLGRDQLEHLASPMTEVRDKSESKYQRVQDKSETIEKPEIIISDRDRTRVLQP